MKNNTIKISIIIVNYNVKDFIELCLESVHQALINIPSEIIVVDNNSADDSVQMLKNRFPKIRLIESNKNLGFSGGNNLGINIAKGDYIVLLNPDTVVQEDTFTTLLSFFEKTSDASAATCKILNPDGTFSVDCRHSIPTPSIAFWKVLGLNKLFPQSRIFGKYNLTYLDENKTYPVEAISGSFMMIKMKIIEKVGLLDETFFMYCEDIDYCYRINQNKGKIYYVPDTQILHYKGESTRDNDIAYIKNFNKALYQFYNKHYHKKYIFPFKWIILSGIYFRSLTIFIRNLFRKYFIYINDLILLNLALYLSWVFEFKSWSNDYILIHIMTTIVFSFSFLYFNKKNQIKNLIANDLKINISTFTIIILLTFLIKQFHFLNIVFFGALIFSLSFLTIVHLYIRFIMKKTTYILGRPFFQLRTLVVGINKESEHLLIKLKSKNSGIKIIGLVVSNPTQIGNVIASFPVVTSIGQIKEYIRANEIDTLIFPTHTISYKQILKMISSLSLLNLEFRLVSKNMNVIISKTESLNLN